MDQSKKKRKVEENGDGGGDHHHRQSLTPEDVRKVIDHFTPDQLIAILAGAASRNPDVLAAVRSVADSDPSRRKLFVRGLGWDTTADGLRSAFSAFGEIDEAVVILDKATGKSKGYGFVTFRHVDSAVMALRDPSKRIEGRVAVAQLASAGNTSSSAANGGGSSAPPPKSDDSARKIYVGNVPYEMSPEKLLAHFSLYGEVEDGPLGFDKQTGKCRGFALFVYKRAEGARAALVNPVKTLDGRQLNCKLAAEGKKGKAGGVGDVVPVSAGGGRGDGAMSVGPGQGPGAVPMGAIPGHPNQFGPGRMGAFSGGYQGNPVYPGGEMGPEGYASGYNNNGAGNGGLGGGTASMYRMPPPSGGGMPGSGGYPPFPAMAMFPGQHHQQLGAGSVGKVPPGGGMYPPPYY